MKNVTEGAILLSGRDISALPPTQRGTAMMFQNYALFQHLSVLDNVAFSLKMKGVDVKERHTKAGEMLGLVDLTPLADRLPDQLSGGQQQRDALARALITRPEVLLLDERLSALDPFLRIRMRGELKKLQKELGISFNLVTHGQDEALVLADEIVVMNDAEVQRAMCSTPQKHVSLRSLWAAIMSSPCPRGILQSAQTLSPSRRHKRAGWTPK